MSRLVFDWNYARIETLRAEWAAGKSASVIAALLGCGITRSAVIGKVHRLGLPTRTNRTRKVKARARPAPPAQPQRGSFALSSPIYRNEAAVRPPTLLAAPVAIRVRKVDPGKPCGILHLTGCKWPVGDDPKTVGRHVFCNAAKDVEASYCEHHAAKVYAGKPVIKAKAKGVWA